MNKAVVILGNQLVKSHPSLSEDKTIPIIMIEAANLCEKYRYHKHKLILLLSAMRSYRDELTSQGYNVRYHQWEPSSNFTDILGEELDSLAIDEILMMHPPDKGALLSMEQMCSERNCKLTLSNNELFLTSNDEFTDWLGDKKPLMEHFYRWQRKRLNILMDESKPTGGKWNWDQENRMPLPKSIDLPTLEHPKSHPHVEAVKELVQSNYPQNPGNVEDFWLPTTRKQSQLWLDVFIETRLKNFGKYEDAMHAGEGFIYHSVLSPLINIGLIHPRDAIKPALEAYDAKEAPLNSVEGYVRQIIGWREYMFGLYWHGPEMKNANFFGFNKELEDWWYTEDFKLQDLPVPILDTLERTHKYGYNHHIERLMVLGNWFLINEYSPKSVFEWFSAMYVDAYDWVMVPNVMGMSQYADGGFVATKPYISGGNYLQKMGSWWPNSQAAKDSSYTEKYWQFLYNQRAVLRSNPRMSLAVNQAIKRYESP